MPIIFQASQNLCLIKVFGLHNHAPQQLAIRLALHQQAADQLGGNQLSGTAEEGLGELLGEHGSYGSGLGDKLKNDMYTLKTIRRRKN